jgi:ornithine cyclodeaminase
MADGLAAILVFGAGEVAGALGYEELVRALEIGFRQGVSALPRNIHDIPGGLVALMPVWGDRIGAVKIATVFPANPDDHGLPTVHAQVLLFDGATGTALAVVEGGELTRRRTAAASALAASYLARADAESLLVIGAGALAPHLASAHAAVRPIRRIRIWGRSAAKAKAVAASLNADLPGFDIAASEDLAGDVGHADVISCVTSAAEPVLLGRWLAAGTHIDLVGGFSPQARECDDDAVRGARIFVDTFEGALAEAGDLLIPIASGIIDRTQIVGELAGLCRREVQGRTSADEITLFKSVGAAIEDLVAAQMVLAAGQSQGTVL